MKTRHFLPLLLALALTGCSAQPDPAQPSATEAPAVQETEALTEAPAETDAPTEAETEAPTEPPTEAADPEQLAYRYIREELIPQYGLSDLGTFVSNNWDGSPSVAPPASTQGIISAVVQDFTGDDTPELMIVRSKDFAYFLNFYQFTGDSYAPLDEYTLCNYDDRIELTPKVALLDSYIILFYNWVSVPGASSFGEGITVLQHDGSSVKALCDINSARHPGSLYTIINGEEFTRSEFEEDSAFDADVIARMNQALDNAGIRHGDASSPFFGVTDYETVMGLEHDDNNGSCYFDNTGLREKLQ